MHHLLGRAKRGPNLDGKQGVTMTSFVVLAIPFMLLMLMLVGDGMAAVATYRRALTLASLGIQAGSTAVDFTGTLPSLSANACAVARQAICANTTCTLATVSCTSAGNVLNITVRLASPSFINNSFRIGPAMTTAAVRGGPKFGINSEE
jgi:hypothetical protein